MFGFFLLDPGFLSLLGVSIGSWVSPQPSVVPDAEVLEDPQVPEFSDEGY